MPRTIVHLDLDAFFCAIEEQRDPSLRGKAFAVGGQPNQRGVVASCSYAARRHGVRSAMSMARAIALCPNLIMVSTRHSDYRAASRQVMEKLHALTPLVEQISIDEAFIDVTKVVRPEIPSRTGRAIGLYLQRLIDRELGLSCSIGVASNKLVAKIATDYGKSTVKTGNSPQAICVVEPGDEAAFLAPLPASALWGVGPKMEASLAAIGIHTIGQIAERSPEELARRFGRHGYDLSQHARGIDKRELVTVREAKSISSETTFRNDVQDWDVLLETLQEQAADVVRALQRHHFKATTVKIKLRWSDFTTPTRQLTLPTPTDREAVVVASATELLRQLWQSEQPVRLLGVGVSGLRVVQQLSLWDADELEAEVAGVARADADSLDGTAVPPARHGESVLQVGDDDDSTDIE